MKKIISEIISGAIVIFLGTLIYIDESPSVYVEKQRGQVFILDRKYGRVKNQDLTPELFSGAQKAGAR